MFNSIFLIVGIAGLITTSYLAVVDKMTLSQRAQALFPRKIDWFIGVGGMIGLCVIKNHHPEFDFSLAVFWSGFWGHIWIANKERYRF